MRRHVRTRAWQALAVIVALSLSLGIVPGVMIGNSVSAQADDLSQGDWEDLVDEIESEDPVYGPEDGTLVFDPDIITFEYADVELADFYVSVTFENPYSGSSDQFDYGIRFRSDTAGDDPQFLHFFVISDGTWALTSGSEEVLNVETYDDLDVSRGGENTLAVLADGDDIHLAINGDYLGVFEAPFDDEGEIAVGTSFLAESFVEDEETSYTDFQIWTIGGNGNDEPEDEDTPEPDDEETPEPDDDETPVDDVDIDGTQYESPTYGYTVIYDDSWEVTDEDSSDDTDLLEISNGPSSLQFSAAPSNDTPEECIETIIDDLSSDDSIGSVDIAVDNNDDEMIGSDDEQAFVVLFVTYATDDGDVDFTAFYQCILLPDEESMLQISHITLADDYNDEIENRVTVLDTLDLEGGGSSTGDEDDEDEPDVDATEEVSELPEGSVTFLLEPVGNRTDLVFGTLIPDGDETRLELLALTEDSGDFVVTIHEGSCRNPDDPAFDLGEIDSSGLLDAGIDIPVEDLTTGDYVMIVSIDGDFVDGAIACGVLEQLPVDE